MFYKFNNIIGRVVPSTQAEAYSPQGLTPLAREPSVITFDSKKTQPAREPAVTMSTRPASSAPAPQAAVGTNLGVVPAVSQYQKIMKLQTSFLKEDGKLVWQKVGRDRLGYVASLGIVAVGTSLCLIQLYTMSFPRQNQD